MKNFILRILDVFKNIFKKRESTITKISLDLIVSNPYQPRRDFDEKALEELSSSIREHGVITPIIVRRMGKRYELVSGERRVRASKLAGLKSIPAIIGNFTDGEMLEIGLLENIQRKNLTAIEEAYGFSHLSRLYTTSTHQEFCNIVAKRIGKRPEDVYKKLLLVSFPPLIREALNMHIITEEQANILRSIASHDKQLKAIDVIQREKLDEEDTKRLIKKIMQDATLEEGAQEQEKEDIIYIFKQLIREYIDVLSECDIRVSITEETSEAGTEIKIKLR